MLLAEDVNVELGSDLLLSVVTLQPQVHTGGLMSPQNPNVFLEKDAVLSNWRCDTSRKKCVLIISFPQDWHARAIAWAIREKGHDVVEWYWSNFPTRTAISLRVFDGKDDSMSVVDLIDGPLVDVTAAIDTIWIRRMRSPWFPDSMHPGDREVADRQCQCTLREVLAILDRPGVYWVNRPDTENAASLKLFQLRKAKEAGLTIPDTLVSNDPLEIRQFIRQCSGRAVFKFQETATWKRNDTGELFGCYTSLVALEDLPCDEILRMSTGIFQPLIQKDWELRVACFGNHLVGLRIDSQADERACVDWRKGQLHIEMKPFELPEDLSVRIRRFLREIGLVSASLDFIKKPDGEFVFLEANPQGQFLFMEDRAGLPLLDIASDYLIDGPTYIPSRVDAPRISFSDFVKAWEDGLKRSLEGHVLISEMRVVPE